MKSHSILIFVLFIFSCSDSVPSEQNNSGNGWTFNGTSQTRGTTGTNNGVTNNGVSNNGTTAQTNNGTTTAANRCPVAIAEGREENRNIWANAFVSNISKTVELRSNSTDVDGTIASYQWSLVSIPDNSLTTLSGDEFQFPSFIPDQIGTYVIELAVFDDDGEESCSPARVTVRVMSHNDLFIELTWETPGDPDPTDNEITDLDLHYLHPFGRWNNPPFDIFFNNKAADWGAAGPSDDPTLNDLGGLLETIVHNNPQNDISYSIGVYYYSDRTFGPSDATIRIYIDGVLQFQAQETLQSTGTFWYVATVSWPSKQISPVNLIQRGFP